MKPYIYITMGFALFWLMIEVASPEVHYFLRYMATPLYAVCILVFGSYSVFKRLKEVTDPSNMDFKDIDEIHKKILENTILEKDRITYRLVRKIQNNIKNDYRHMWE